MRCCTLVLLLLTMARPAMADVTTETIEYRDGDIGLVGFLAYDSAKAKATTPLPGVMIVHQWMGVTDYEKSRCEQLAKLGYVAFACDVYGAGVRPSDTREAGATAGIYKNDRELYRHRLNLGLAELRKQKQVAEGKLAAIGYCFGGTGVIELARSGAKVDGVVSFHGGLDSPTPDDGKNISAKVLICHGADDPFVSPSDIDAMKAEFNGHQVDWQMNIYSGAVHSFTQPMAGNDNSKGAAYNEQADVRSFQAMAGFFNELFSVK